MPDHVVKPQYLAFNLLIIFITCSLKPPSLIFNVKFYVALQMYLCVVMKIYYDNSTAKKLCTAKDIHQHPLNHTLFYSNLGNY